MVFPSRCVGGLVMIVVTGASGFIGSNVVAALNQRGVSDIVAVDDYPELRGDGLSAETSELRYADRMLLAGAVDLHDFTAWLQQSGSNVDGVIHLGACSDTTVSDRNYVMSRNYSYSQTLWNWCTDAQRPLVYASSAATYGGGENGYDDQVDPRIYKPLNLYGESKHLFDLWALKQRRTPPRWAGVKYFNVYGPNEDHKGRMASVVFHAFHQIARTGEVQLFQSHRPDVAHGGQRRDFVYVADVVDATLHLFDTPVSEVAANGLYNVGTGHARTFDDLVRSLFNALEREPRIAYVPMPKDLREKYQYFTEATMCKFQQTFGCLPFRSIELGVDDYVKYHLLPLQQIASDCQLAPGDLAA